MAYDINNIKTLFKPMSSAKSGYLKSTHLRSGVWPSALGERLKKGGAKRAYFQIIFLNRSHEVIKTFHSLQENLQHAKLVYSADGGLKSASFSVLFNQTIPTYNDMMIQFRTNSFGLGTVFSQKVSLRNGVLTIEGVSVFNRLAKNFKLSGNISQSTLKTTVLYFLGLIYEELLAQEEPPFFSINPDKVLVDDEIIINSLFFIDKKPQDILQGLANVAGGKVVYGVDEHFEFYFIDQKRLPTERCWVDHNAFNASLVSQEEGIVNQVKLFSQRQNGEQLGLLATHNNLASQAEFGIKSAEVNLPFFIESTQAEHYAALFVTPQPALQGHFTVHNRSTSVHLGRWQVAQNLSEPVRLLANSCKELRQLSHQNLSAVKVQSGHTTGRFAYQFEGVGTLNIEAIIPSCERVLVSLSNTQPLFLEWFERGQPRTQTVPVSPVVRQVVLTTCAVDDGLLLRVTGRLLLDSLHFVSAFVRQDEGFYTGHEVVLRGDASEITVQLGRDDHHLVELTKQLQTNARQLDDLLKRHQ